MSWREWFDSGTGSRSLVHPSAPKGGGGPGGFRRAGPLGVSHPHAAPHHHHRSHVPHPRSPAAKSFDWHRLPIIDQAERVKAVWDAIQLCPRFVPQAIKRATGEELHALVAGLVPGLLLALGIMAVTTLGGAAAGAALGALAGGVGAAPGAVAGAAAGAEAGAAILEWLGLAFLVVYVAKSLVSAAERAKVAVDIAWHSVDKPATSKQAITQAAHILAEAVADVFRGVLQGVVAFLLSKGAGAAKARMPELLGKLRASKLGEGFAAWVERNWEGLLENPKLGGRPPRSASARAPNAAPTSRKAPPSTPPPEPVKPPAPKPAEEAPPKTKPKPKKPVASDLANIEAKGAKPVRVKQGTNDKVAVIGRNMEYVRAEGAELQKRGYDVELFDDKTIPKEAMDDWNTRTAGGRRIPEDEAVETPMYEANKAWAEKLKDEGYTVVDMGNPSGKGPSKFYEMEGDTVFGDSE